MVLHVEIKGFNPDIQELDELDGSDKPQEESSSDTTDVDEAGDIEELLNPGDPVYFNYATDANIPASLTVSTSNFSITLYNVTILSQNPGKSFSIKGRLVAVSAEKSSMYKFDLHCYTKQV